MTRNSPPGESAKPVIQVMQRLRNFLTLAIVLTTWAVGWAQDYDVVIKNGRVMDPETSYNSVANVGIRKA
jgi:hypothetical protein